MNTSCNETEEMTPLLRSDNIRTDVQDTQISFGKRFAVGFILGSILFERMAFYSLANNLVSTLHSNETLKWNLQHSAAASYIFFGTRYIFTLIFAALCDAKLGRAKTISIGFTLYLIGYIFVVINANKQVSFCHFPIVKNHTASSIFDESCAPWVLSTIICTAIAAGTVQSNLAVFGAEQIRQLPMVSRYSDKYMFAVNIGDLLSLLTVPYIQKDPAYFYIGYLIATLMLIVAIVLFIISCRYAIHGKPYDTVMTKCIPVVINAFQSRRHWAVSSSLNDTEESRNTFEQPSTFLDFATVLYHGKFQDRIVNDVKSLGRVIIVFTLVIPYWLIYSQINSTFSQQGTKMKLSPSWVPIVWMTLPIPLIIIFGIFIINKLIYEYFNSWSKERIIATKFIIGMCFAFISMCTAGIVEIYRQKKCDDKNQSTLLIYAQLPQNIFIGFSELFAVVASYEYAFFSAPRSAQSLFMSFRFTAAGVASFIGLAFSNYFLKPADDDTNSNCLGHNESWRYYVYFFILAGFQLIFIIIFIQGHKKLRLVKLNLEEFDAT